GPGFPGDFDGDGAEDLLVELRAAGRVEPSAGIGHGTGLYGMALLRNVGAGHFVFAGLASAPGVSFALDSLAASASLVADVDLDGELDLFTRTAHQPYASRLWLNHGAGTFKPGSGLGAAVADVRVEETLDVELDGLLDLVVTRRDTYLGSLRGKPGGGFVE